PTRARSGSHQHAKSGSCGDMKSANAAHLSSDVAGSSPTPIRRVQGSSSTTTIGGLDVIERHHKREAPPSASRLDAPATGIDSQRAIPAPAMSDVSPPASPPVPFDPAAHGWEPVASAAFGQLVGPIWQRDEGERLRFGLIVAPKHANRAGNLHGGMLMTMADQAMAFTARKATGKQHATMELHIHFVGVVKLGEFVEA